MKFRKIFNYLLFKTFYLLLSVLISCNTEPNKQTPPLSTEQIKKPMEKVNKLLVKSEDEEINDFINRYKWKMIKTHTGLRYMIYKNGNGEKAETGKIVKINYEVRFLNGTFCYSSKQDGPKEFQLGKSNAESGLQEAILHMQVGDRAKIIIPSHLAFGLHGDEKKIPERATLVYDVDLLEIKSNY